MSESLTASGRIGLKRTTVREVAEVAIREKILAGDLAPASRLNEVSIADELGISRGPLREAIQRLASEGLLEMVPHKGAFVTALDEKQLRELYELRIAVETFSARKICASLPKAKRTAIREPLRAAKAARRGAGPYPAEPDFHRSLLALAENAAIDQVSRDVNTRISIARSRSAREPTRARQAYEEHRAICDAIVSGQGDRAASLLQDHLWRSFESAVALLLG